MLIIDASALYDLLTRTPAAERIKACMIGDTDHAAPHIVDVEVFGVIRRHFRSGWLDATAASQAVDDLRDWRGQRFAHQPFLWRAWQLRDHVRGWDAMYVALAEAFQATLITVDQRLGRVPGLSCNVEVISRDLA